MPDSADRCIHLLPLAILVTGGVATPAVGDLMRTATSVAAFLLLSATALNAQDIRGHLQGRVIDSAGNPIGTVDVVVRSTDLQGERSAATNRNGDFALRWLPVGSYQVELRRIGYESLVVTDIVVRLGRTTTIGVVEMVETPVELEAISAEAQRLLIDPESTAGGVNLTPELFRNLPNDRDYRSMVTMAPAVNGYRGTDLSVAGGTGPETAFFVEGANVTSPVTGLEATRLPYNFVREIQVKTGGYEAEYRSTLGGIVNVVTHSGSNVFESQVFGYYTSDRLEGTPRFGLSESTRQNQAQYDIGVTIGGPILRDRLWYFAAYNPSVVTEDIAIPEFGTYDDRGVQHVFAGKLSWRAADRTNLFFTAFGDPGTRDKIGPMSISTAHFTPLNPETWMGEEAFGGVNFVLGGTQLIGDNGLLEASISSMSRRESYLPTTDAGARVQIHDYTTETVSGGTTKYGETSLGRFNLALKSTWELGRHTFKAGGEWSTSDRTVDSYTHNVIKRLGLETYREVNTSSSGGLSNRVGGLFVQDSWRVTDRWRLNLGLRWEAQGFEDTNGDIAQTIDDQWAPRLGFVFQPGQLGTQRIYGSAGRFYQDMLLNGLVYFDGETWQIWEQCDGDPRLEGSNCEILSDWGASISEPVPGLEGQHFDELTLGYDRQIGSSLKLGARGVYRTLRRAIEDASVDEDGADWLLGNPGYGPLSEYPSANREYLALELTAEKTIGTGLMLVGSYVLSRTQGNYPGLFDADWWSVNPNTTGAFDFPDLMENADGLMPQDRRHSIKFSASYATRFGLSAGARFLWQSGSPLSIRGGSAHPPQYMYLAERGSMGETPNIWDLDLRLAYDFAHVARRSSPMRVVLDVFNVGNPREAVAYDQVATFTMTDEGDQTDINPNYLQPTRFQPPTMVRLGFELGF
ncbi:MAG: TonB-dependent receptor [marine benthic group bacterium]|nr:TonB-dependent receptor [Gemmatimonadota bacterium]